MLNVECSGSAYEIGHQHGAQAAVQVKRSIAFYEALFLAKSRLQWPAVCDEAQKWLPYLEASWPEYVEEMKGLATGSGTSFPSILALNVRTEIAFGLSFPTSSSTLGGCTALACHAAGQPQTAILAQNWDWEEEQAPNLVHLRVRNPPTSSKASLLSFVTEAGIIGKIGLNSDGIGTCLNAVRAPGVSYTKLPVHLALRAALDCDVAKLKVLEPANGHVNGNGPSPSNNATAFPSKRSAEMATRILDSAGVASAAHILIADSEKGFGLETSCEEIRTVPVDDIGNARVLLHTNHFVVPSHKVADVKDWFASSSARQDRILELMKSADGINAADVERFLQDEQGYPFSICRDVDPKTKSTIATIFSIVMDLQERRAKVKVGRPSQPSEVVEIDARV